MNFKKVVFWYQFYDLKNLTNCTEQAFSQVGEKCSCYSFTPLRLLTRYE